MEYELNNSYSDYQIDEIKWNENGSDLTIQLSFENEKEELLFVWVSDLIIDLKYEDYIGKALIFEIDFKKIENGRKEIFIDVSPMGSISLKCNSIQIKNNKL